MSLQVHGVSWNGFVTSRNNTNSTIDFPRMKDVLARYVAQQSTSKDIAQAESVVSIVGTSISSCSYMLVLVTFAISKEHFPGYGLISLCVTLMSSDLLYLLVTILDSVEATLSLHLCKTLGIVMHFVLLIEQLCIVVLAVDNMMTFRKLQVHVNEPAKQYYRKRWKFVLIPLLLTVFAIILDYAGVLDEGNGGNGLCMKMGFDARAIFYIIPAAISFISAICLMVFTLVKLRQHTQLTDDSSDGSKIRTTEGSSDGSNIRSTEGSSDGSKIRTTEGSSDGSNIRTTVGSSDGSNICTTNVAVIALKLIIAYGLVDVLGLIYEVNEVVGLVYTIVRSMRGIMFFIIYMCRKSVVKFYKRL